LNRDYAGILAFVYSEWAFIYSVEVWEFKGVELPEWKLKRKLFEDCYPSIPYRVRKTVRI
jgi:hypothetical protein